jgi:hypothetical protein
MALPALLNAIMYFIELRVKGCCLAWDAAAACVLTQSLTRRCGDGCARIAASGSQGRDTRNQVLLKIIEKYPNIRFAGGFRIGEQVVI